MCMSSDKHFSNCFPATCAAASALFTLSVSIVEGKRGYTVMILNTLLERWKAINSYEGNCIAVFAL
jgi:hypothetical protein